jgi:hypothetical protein
MFRIPRIINSMFGGDDQIFINDLLTQLDAAREGAVLTRKLIAGEILAVDAVEQMRNIEHRGDDARASLVANLRRALITPLDREDLFRLSRSLDDILDNLRDFVRAWSLFEMEKSVTIEPVIDAVCDALVDLREAIVVLGSTPSLVTTRSLAAKKSGNAIRRAYDNQLAVQYRATAQFAANKKVSQMSIGKIIEIIEASQNEKFKVTRLLRCLDVVGIRFGEAADILSDAMIKRAED